MLNIFLISLNPVMFLSEGSSIGLNLDILETGIVNIAILGTGVFILGRDFLSSALSARQGRVIAVIQESEDNLNAARLRLSEAEKQLSQTQILISEIKKESELTAQKVQAIVLKQGKLDIEKIVANSRIAIAAIEVQIRQQIQTYITNLLLKRVTGQLEKQLTLDIQSSIIDKDISNLGGSVWL
jgi:F0F1-type ATP synthase membrane subunit b/b'